MIIFLKLSKIALCFVFFALFINVSGQNIKVTLLGTGTTSPIMERFGPSIQEIIPATRKNYSGAVELGEDLMVIEVGEKVEISRPFAKIFEAK